MIPCISNYLIQSEKGGAAVTTVIKKSGAENRLMEFFPSSNQQQTEENFAKSFAKKDLPEVVAFRKQVRGTKMLTKNVVKCELPIIMQHCSDNNDE